MKKKFETPELTIIYFSAEDIIVTSNEGPGGDYGMGGDEGSGNYGG